MYMDLDDQELERLKMRKMREYLEEKTGKTREGTGYPSEPLEVSDANFDELVSRYPVVVVDFWAEWCAPCRAIAPVVKEMAKEMAGKVVFGKLNVDDNPATAARFGIMSIPTLLIFKDGRPVDAIIGALPKRHLAERIMRYAG